MSHESSSFRYVTRLSDIYEEEPGFLLEDRAGALENHDRETEDALSAVRFNISSSTTSIGAIETNITSIESDIAGLDTSLDSVNTSLYGAWSTYVPTLVQSGTVTTTVTRASYKKIGFLVHVDVVLTVTGSGTTGNAISVGLPVTATSLTDLVGTGLVFDTSAGLNYWASSYAGTTTTVQLYDSNTRLAIGVDPAFALASGDVVHVHGFYESAA